MPKLYLRSTRYLIWRQIRSHPNVTALSSTLACTVGAYSRVCRGRRASASGPSAAADADPLSNANATFLKTFCHEYCGTRQALGGSGYGSGRSQQVRCVNQ